MGVKHVCQTSDNTIVFFLVNQLYLSLRKQSDNLAVQPPLILSRCTKYLDSSVPKKKTAHGAKHELLHKLRLPICKFLNFFWHKTEGICANLTVAILPAKLKEVQPGKKPLNETAFSLLVRLYILALGVLIQQFSQTCLG